MSWKYRQQMKAAVVALEAGDYALADKILTSLLDSKQEPVEALIHRAYTRLRAGQLETAAVDAQRAVELRPESGIFRMILGEILIEQKKIEAAVDILRQAAQLERDNGRALFQLGRALKLMGRPGEAADYFEAALQFERDYVMAQSLAYSL